MPNGRVMASARRDMECFTGEYWLELLGPTITLVLFMAHIKALRGVYQEFQMVEQRYLERKIRL